MRASTQALVLLSIACPSLGALYTSPDQLPTRTFDYVVVGAGAAGPILVNRLSENKDVSVLLLEAGKQQNVDDVRMPVPLYAPPMMPRTILDWNYTTTPQADLYNRQVPYLRGRVLGGTTSINYMIHNTGPIDDWEYYAKVTGDKGWSWDGMRKYFLKSERMVPPADGRDTKGEWDPSVHGKDGILSLSLPGFKNPIDKRIVAATKELPKDFPYNIDQNSGKPMGISWTQARIQNGERDSSATAYLADKYLARPNLHVLVNAHVNKVVKTGTRSGQPIFRGVEFSPENSSSRITLLARKEVVLCAGVINTPKILQLSGIGDKEDLSKFGITTLVNSPSVGKNLSDHPLMVNRWTVNDNSTYDPFWEEPKHTQEHKKWEETRKGPLTNTVTNLIGWHRIPDGDPILKKYRDPSTGSGAPHSESIYYNTYFAVRGIPRAPFDNFMSILTVLASPASRGFVTISSSNPLDKPIIDPKFYSDPFDFSAMAHGIQQAIKMADSKSFDGFTRARYGANFAAAKDENSFREYIKKESICLFHGVGTASMSPKGAPWGVLDPDLTVKGTIGLRVADASAIPYVPSAHPMGPIQALAERAADLIKEAYSFAPAEIEDHAQFRMNSNEYAGFTDGL